MKNLLNDAIKINRYIIISLICSILLSASHVALERNLLTSTFLCSKSHEDIANVREDLYTEIIQESNNFTSCNTAYMKILNISLTEYNLLLSIMLLGIFLATNFYIYNKCFSEENFFDQQINASKIEI